MHNVVIHFDANLSLYIQIHSMKLNHYNNWQKFYNVVVAVICDLCKKIK